RGEPATRRTDIYSAGVVLWEMLTGRRLFDGNNEAAIFGRVLEGRVTPPSASAPGISSALDALVLRAVARDPRRRFATAHGVALAIEGLGERASPTEVGRWVVSKVGPELARRAELIRTIERVSATGDPLAEARSAVSQRRFRMPSLPPLPPPPLPPAGGL